MSTGSQEGRVYTGAEFFREVTDFSLDFQMRIFRKNKLTTIPRILNFTFYDRKEKHQGKEQKVKTNVQK